MTFFTDGEKASARPVKFQIRRSFSATLENVFDAWLIPYLAGSWMFGSKDPDQEVIRLENKPLPGGSFILEVIRQGQRHLLCGEYREIRRPDKLSCTIGDDPETAALVLLTMELYEDNGKTRMKLSFELSPALAGHADSMREQWNTRCRALAAQVEQSRKQTRLFR